MLRLGPFLLSLGTMLVAVAAQMTFCHCLGPFCVPCFVWCWIFKKKNPIEGHGWGFQCYGDGGGGEP